LKKAILCPECGYNAGENGEAILELHMKATHKKTMLIPTEKEAALVGIKGAWICQNHPETGKMSFLEFNRHKESQSQSLSATGILLGGLIGGLALRKQCVPVQIEP
jgi:hypothetical protein